jgi:hypothetical protein
MSAELQTMGQSYSMSSNFVEQIKPDPTYIETDTYKMPTQYVNSVIKCVYARSSDHPYYEINIIVLVLLL